MPELIPIGIIGGGSFGYSRVFQVEDDKNQNHQYALKVLPKNGYDRSRFDSETDRLYKLDHENIATFHGGLHIDNIWNGIFRIPENGPVKYPALGILMDVYDSNLRIMMQNMPNICDGFNRHKFRQMLYGLEYLYDEGILHRNLKPENVRIHENVVKLSDFGVGHYDDGSDPYRAPETDEDEFSEESDIYSLGVIFIEMYTTFDDFSQWLKIPNPIPKNHFISDHLVSIAANMLQYWPEYRPKISTLINKI